MKVLLSGLPEILYFIAAIFALVYESLYVKTAPATWEAEVGGVVDKPSFS